MANTSDIKNGMVLNHNHGLWQIVEFLHVKPGKGAAFVRTKLKNIETGKVVDHTFNAGHKIDPCASKPESTNSCTTMNRATTS